MLVTCVAAVTILFIGMRAPDSLRPYRPKPPQNAFIEKQVKACPHEFEKCQELGAIPAQFVEPEIAAPYRAHDLFALQATQCHPLFPNSSRAPPLLSA